MDKTIDWLKKNIEPLLVVGAQIKIGRRYVKEEGGFKPGEIITLIQGYFERDNGLYDGTETAPSIWNKDSEDFDSIYHLFSNDLENWYDCKIVKPNDNGQDNTGTNKG